MALNKDIFEKKGTLSFRVSDLFNSAMYQSHTFTPTFKNDVVFRRSLPSFNFSMTYRVNQKANQQRQRSSGNRGSNDGDGFGF